MPNTTLEHRLQAARPEVDDGERRLEDLVASRLFGVTHAEPARVGRFTLLARIGRGGMGDVYAAYDPVLDRKVALKLLRADAGVHALRLDERRSLLVEARAAARLAHPNVVSIYEVGEVGEVDESIFVAMEFIDGPTLRAWLRGRRSIEQILGVFIDAGRGLAAAHDAGVVHRDFKPENVLISGSDGDELRGRVVDFGLARVTGHRRVGTLNAAAEGQSALMGTLAYMAPEQLLRRAVDARTDQFSFCVALCEALAGRHPFGADEPGLTGDELRARVLAGDCRLGERSLPGWLRRVLRRGLLPDPSARHASMHALVRELRATPERRKRRSLITAGVALAVASSAATIAGLDRVTTPPCNDGDLAAVWDDSVRTAVRAALTTSRLVDAEELRQRLEHRLDEYSGAWRVARQATCRALHDEVGAVDAARLREVCLLRRRAELGGLTAAFADADPTTLSSAIAAVDQLTPISVCDDVESLRRELVSPAPGEDLVTLESIRQEILGLVTWVRAGRGREVEPQVAALVAAAHARASPALLAEALQLRGLLEEALGAYDAAAATLEAAVREAIAGRHDRLHAELAVKLVWLHGVYRRRTEDAIAWVEHADAAIRAIGGEPRLRTRLLDHRGVIAAREHDHATAERLHRAAIEVRGSLSSTSDVELAMSMSNLGSALLSQGKVTEAESQIHAALERYRAALGPHHPTVAAVLSNLGQAQIRAGKPDRGLELLHDALALKERSLGRDHVALLSTLNNLGNAYSELGRCAEARQQYRRALELGERVLGPDSPELEYIVHNLAFESWRLGAHDEVIRHTTRALELQRRLHGESNPVLAPTLELHARGLHGVGRVGEAVTTIERALVLASGGVLDPEVRGNLLLSAAWILRGRAAPDRVRALAREAESLLGPAAGPEQTRELTELRSSDDPRATVESRPACATASEHRARCAESG